MDAIQQLQTYIDKSRRIVFFGGAGVSTESGIPDFRSADGLYHRVYKYPPERIISHSFFQDHPEEFFAFYRSRVLFQEALPNPAHTKLKELEEAGRLSAIITQNIDGLHQKAGSQNVLELHGSVWRNYCTKCSRAYDISTITASDRVPRCECGGVIRPDVVLYEESLDPLVLQQAHTRLREADLLIIGGTSLVVYPAAALARLYSGPLILINKGETPQDKRASLLIRENIGEVFSQLRASPV